MSTAPAFHPSIVQVLRYFDFRHLPPHLQDASRPWAERAFRTALAAPDSPETTVALRKLLEAKDAAVRAVLPGDPAQVVAELRELLGL